MTASILRLYGPGPLDQLDPVCCPRFPIDRVVRLFARQLFTYRTHGDLRNWQSVAPTPDLATAIPSIYNAGMGASYTSYVVHLRPGVYWDSDPVRPVTTHDVVRGIKRMGNPLRRSALLPYFTDTIRGMARFCDDYAAAFAGVVPTGPELAEYQNSHDIPGLLVLDDHTIVFEIRRPAFDFIDILALPGASPAPIEYDEFVPGSLELCRNIRSNGPYRPVDFTPGRTLRLTRNRLWHQETDPVRRQHVDAVEVVSEPVAADAVAHRIRRDRADLAWGVRIADPATPVDHDLGFALDPYLVFNTRSFNAAGALRKVQVRQAIAHAIDKTALAAELAPLDGETITRVAGSIVPPNNDGHQDLDPYSTPDQRGDPVTCAAMLAAAGHPDGLTITAIHPATARARLVAHRCAADLTEAGIAVQQVEFAESEYLDLLADPARAESGEWDIALASWSPAWAHDNGRVFLQPLLHSGSPANLGHYRNPEVDALIDRALAAAEDRQAADAAWRKAERVALADAPLVPLLFQVPTARELCGRRVRAAAVLPAHGLAVDLATVRLDPPSTD
ncbi:peptide/nickel transport system substrate-binding protein [Nocardia tenerifensis]|uniref:Peptide/nickel transport system substrate-binding protein n=1 Tax=Nocardia tenerifensis TaxID=228006 RepID=A0A318K7V7_9NOCA|nr:ABC transporter substrate-binding protein [Nocardia tenerifensis]PXX70601.1 peptide/nickel transport system substrate-binding protein [Nocardia tenerifensis]